jgi:hypothetical protein
VVFVLPDFFFFLRFFLPVPVVDVPAIPFTSSSQLAEHVPPGSRAAGNLR